MSEDYDPADMMSRVLEHVGLIPLSDIALDAAMEREGISATDAVNRALQVYNELSEQRALGYDVMVRRTVEKRHWFLGTKKVHEYAQVTWDREGSK